MSYNLFFSIFSTGGHVVQQSRIKVGDHNSAFRRKYALLARSFRRNQQCILEETGGEGFEAADSHDGPGSLTGAKISSGGHFVQRSGTILAISVKRS